MSLSWDSIKNWLSGVGNAVEGNPAGAQQELSQLQQQAYAQGNSINQMLQGEKAQAEQYYRPMQQMFGSMYGTGGVRPGVAPGMPGSTPLTPGGSRGY
jgi:hypothetical protein